MLTILLPAVVVPVSAFVVEAGAATDILSCVGRRKSKLQKQLLRQHLDGVIQESLRDYQRL